MTIICLHLKNYGSNLMIAMTTVGSSSSSVTLSQRKQNMKQQGSKVLLRDWHFLTVSFRIRFTNAGGHMVVGYSHKARKFWNLCGFPIPLGQFPEFLNFWPLGHHNSL
jgi:hypothetical protein